MSYWAVAQTETRREHIARQFLMRAGFVTYCPRIKRQGSIVPLFPSYLFIQIESAWYQARWSVGIRKILMSGEAPAHMADDIIDAIRGREIDGLVTLPRAPRLKPGQKVRVVRGSFEGLVGIYDGMSGIDRERILLDLLGRKVQVTLAGRDVVAAELAK